MCCRLIYMSSYQIQKVAGRGTRTGKSMFEILYADGRVAATCDTRPAAERLVAVLTER